MGHDWPTRHALSIVLRLSSDKGPANGRDFKEPAWRELVQRTAARAITGLSTALAAARAAERQQARNQRVRDHVAEQCASLIDRWLAEARPELRERALDVIHATMDAERLQHGGNNHNDDDDDDGDEPATVRAWVEKRLLAQLK